MTPKILINRSAVIIGLALGAFALSALATSQWNPPTDIPPNNNVDAPINVGLNSQSKLGQLFVNADTSAPYATGLKVWGLSVLYGGLQIPKGAQDGYVLTSDASGNATWKPSGGVTPPPTTHTLTIKIVENTYNNSKVLMVYYAPSSNPSNIQLFCSLPEGSFPVTAGQSKTCSGTFTSTDQYILTTGSSGSGTGHNFNSWSGACSGAGSCTVNMSSDVSAVATFN